MNNSNTPNHEFVELNNSDLLTIEGGSNFMEYIKEFVQRLDIGNKRSENDNSIKRG